MITAQTPWTSKLRDGKTIVSDASGNEIGSFDDWQNADMIIEMVNDRESLQELRGRIDDLEGESAGSDRVIEDQDEKIAALEKENEAMRSEIMALKTPAAP